MVGLTLLAAAAAYIGVVYALVRFGVKNNWARAAVVLAALAIPFWDVPISYARFQNFCKTEGGLRVGQPLPPQTAVCVDSSLGFPPQAIARMGFQIVEVRDAKGTTRHHFGSGSDDHAETKYCVSVDQNQRLSWNIWRHDLHVYEKTSGAAVASYSQFHWPGGWIQTNLVGLPGGGATCHPLRPDQLLALIRNGRT